MTGRRRLIAQLLAAGGLASCGRQGPLRLPPEEPPAAPADTDGAAAP